MSGAARVRTAAGVLRAAMVSGRVTPEELAQVLEDCQLLQSPETVTVRGRLVRPAVLVERYTIAPDVDEDSPAAALARRLRESQPDVTGTEVQSETYVRITVRPQSEACLHWWLARFKAEPATGTDLTDLGGSAYGVLGHHKDVTVYLLLVGDAVTAWNGTAARHAS
ncbi:MAG: hypothetical protein HOZ81_23665 [Streptomyces sp.]|nr:hypothetical protein [Streptomyces sp.]